MSPKSRFRRNLRGFTLIELLVVISIIAILAGILLPAIQAVTKAAKVAATQSLVARLDVALSQYQKDMIYVPPDFVPGSYAYIKPFRVPGMPIELYNPGLALPPEALYYFLTNPFIAGQPYCQLRQSREANDYNKNNLPEAVDPWGQPILYNRGAFPGHMNTTDYWYFNYAGSPPSGYSTNYEAPDHKPWHNKEGADVYSLGPDGTTGGRDGQAGRDKPPTDLSQAAAFQQYVERAMRAWDYPSNASHGPLCGNEEDDIPNWK